MSQLHQAAQEGTIELLYFDEAGFSCLPNAQRRGSPLGQPHTANASLGRKRVNAMGALDYTKGKLHFELYEHNIRREHVIPFFDHLAKSSDPDKFTFLTLDNASIHKNIEPAITLRWQADLKSFLLYLPPYSPELISRWREDSRGFPSCLVHTNRMAAAFSKWLTSVSFEMPDEVDAFH